MFYIYEWIDLDTNEIFYVGKGTHNRYKVRKHNRLFNEKVNSLNCESRIIEWFETEEDAFLAERKRIDELKKIGQCSCNIFRGGKGGSVKWWTQELRQKYSTNNIMKTKEQRERMSKNNPMKSKVVQDKVKKFVAKPIIIDGIEYPSKKSVVDKFRVSYEVVKHWCRKGITSFGKPCRVKGEPQIEFTDKRYNKGTCRAINYDGKVYEGAVDVAKELNIDASVVTRWAKKGFSKDGKVCQYLDDKNKYVFKKYVCGEQNKIPIIVNGIWYPSRKEAEEQLGLSNGYLAPYIKGTRKNNKYICEYANQQPSTNLKG